MARVPPRMSGSRATQAVVLAAGRGSRMGAATAALPKCLVPIGGRPLLDWTLAALRACGIDDVLVVGGWQHAALQGRTDACVVNPRWRDTHMVRSLQCADAWLQRADTLVVYGDGAYGARMLSAVLDAPPADVLVPGDRAWHALWSLRFDDPLQDAEAWRDDGARLHAIGARADTIGEIGAQFMGLLRLTPAGWRTIVRHLEQWETECGTQSVDRLDTTGLLQRLLDAAVPVACTHVDGGWVEIDSERDRAVVEQALRRPGFVHDFR